MISEQRANLPEGIECKFCNDGRLFHHLAGHLYYIHRSNLREYRAQFDIPADASLHSRQFSENRSRAASEPANDKRVTDNRAIREERLLAGQVYIISYVTKGEEVKIKKSPGFSPISYTKR